MAMIDVTKKIKKNADSLGIGPGETILAACTTNPSGTMQRMLAREIGGAIGGAFADRNVSAADAEFGLASRFPEGRNFVVVTDQRLLCTAMSALTGKPKGVNAEWTREELHSIVVEDGKLASPMTFAFTDGTAVKVEGAKGTDPAALGRAIEPM